MTRSAKQEWVNRDGREPYRVRLPGFLVKEEAGLGDVIKRATYSVGIRPCGACAARATRLNNWMVLVPRRR